MNEDGWQRDLNSPCEVHWGPVA